MGEFEYQHMVPRTYFKPWERLNSNRKLNIINKTTGELNLKSSKREFGIKDFYTITTDNHYIFTEADKQLTYRSLFNYDIEFKSKKLTDIKDFHKEIGKIEQWEIRDKDGNRVENEDVIKELKSIRIIELEKNWNRKVERSWNITIQNIASNVKSKTPLSKKDYDFLYLFLISQKIRTKRFKDYISESMKFELSSLFQMPKDINERKKIEYEFDKMFDSLFKKIIRDFQDENSNKSVEAIIKYFERFSMVFYYNYNKSFYTSDNPIVDEVDEALPTKYKGQIFPLTPHLIVIGYKGNKGDNQYSIQELNDVEVDEINELVIKNAIEKYITD